MRLTVENLDVKIPLNMLTCITGVSGSGKSSLIKYLIRHDDQLIKIGKENIGLNSRSNIATYTKTFDIIRYVFSKENKVKANDNKGQGKITKEQKPEDFRSDLTRSVKEQQENFIKQD